MKTLLLLLSSLFLLDANLKAQSTPSPLTDEEKSEVVDSIQSLLANNYVYPEIAEEMNRTIQQRLNAGAYEGISDPMIFAETLTEDLRSISQDLHLRVQFGPERSAALRARQNQPDNTGPSPEALERIAATNFGFNEVKIMEGNIGYIDLRGFSEASYAGETAVAAMNFVSNADAIVFDLRNNGGGSPSMIRLLTSYLYGNEAVHLNDFYWRPTDEFTQSWTMSHVQGKKNPDALVYVLTSGRTFSAAEEFSYNLKNLERATLVGETTGGGAHPGGTMPATDRFLVWVPQGRAINPITKTNWEGTGVTPHVEVPANEALEKVHLLALNDLIKKTENPQKKERLEWSLQGLKAIDQPLEIDEKILKSYVGTYGPRNLIMEDGTLFYQRENGPKNELLGITETLFMFEAAPFFRLEVAKEDGRIIGLRGHYEGGRTDFSPIDIEQP